MARKKKLRCTVCNKLFKRLGHSDACMKCHRRGRVKRKPAAPERADWAAKMKYADYLQTDHWKGLRTQYCPRGTRCSVCSMRKKLELHHVHYRLGKETLGDVIPVCRTCHKLIHDTLNNLYPDMPLSQKVQRTDAAIRTIHGEKVHVEITPPKKPQEAHRPTMNEARIREYEKRQAASKAHEEAQRKKYPMVIQKRLAPDVPLTVRGQLKITTGRRLSEMLHHRRPADGQGESTASRSDDQPGAKVVKHLPNRFDRRAKRDASHE